MTKFIVASLAIVAIGSAGAAENPALRANVGVGLGTMLFEAMGYTDTVLGQTLAATTNKRWGDAGAHANARPRNNQRPP